MVNRINSQLFAFVIALSLAVSAFGQEAPASNAERADLNTSIVENAISQVESNAELTEEARSQLLDSYRRTQGFIKTEQSYKQSSASFQQAREQAAAEAAEIQGQLETDTAAFDGTVEPPGDKVELAEVEQLIQRDKAELAALEAKASDISNRLERETGRPKQVRDRITALKQLQDELAAQLKEPSTSKDVAQQNNARRWLLMAQSTANRAESASLEQELLSQPMRIARLNARRDRTAFDISVLQARINIYELHAIKLRQGAAEKAQVAAETAQADAQGKHPLILALAQANTDLSSQITARTAALENLKSEEALANDSAQSLESDLEGMRRKLEVLGMSQALGRVMREQRMRLPDRVYSRSDLARRDDQITASSLRQFDYEDERQQLRSLKGYVQTQLGDIEPEVADDIRKDLTELAKARRDLISRAIDVETTYLRSLGDLDFAARRLIAATGAYREFISKRLLWIRTSTPLSLDTFKPLPTELAAVFAPTEWVGMLQVLLTAFAATPIYLLFPLLSLVLLRYRSKLLGLLESTGKNVGNVDTDTYVSSWTALAYTLVLAVTYPVMVLGLSLALKHAAIEGSFDAAVAHGLDQISTYLFGLAILKYLLLPQGLLQRHFLWTAGTIKSVSDEFRSLTRIFIPSVFLAIVATRVDPTDGESTLGAMLLVVTLAAIARFYARLPNIMVGHLDQLLRLQANPRRSFMGQAVRYFMIIVPCLLIVSILLGFRHTATAFLVLLLLTNALIVVLLLTHEFGIRWLKIIRRRLIKAERQAQRAAVLERAQHQESESEVIEEHFDEPDPDVLDEEGRKLLNMAMVVAAIFGIWAVWVDVLPALGIFNSIELWQTTTMVNGVETPAAITLADLCIAGLIGFAGYVATQRIPSMLEILLRNRMKFEAGTVYAGVTLFQYGLITVVIISVLGSLGASWGQIQWAVAALSVGIGFGLQEIVANFISGLILLFEQPIRVGDTVTVGETSGVVTRIRMRATTIRDWDRRELLVPNKEFITGRLLNWSLSDKLTRIVITVGVAYGTNLRKAMDLAMEAAHEHPEVLDDPAPFITFDEFGDNALTIVLRAYLSDMDSRLTVSSQIRTLINDKFNDAGIVVAFPQRDVHLDTSAPLNINVRNLDGGAPAE